MRGLLFRINGTDVAIYPGFFLHLIGFMRDPETGTIALGLGFVRIAIEPAPHAGTAKAPPKAEEGASNVCPVCEEPVLPTEESSFLPMLGATLGGFVTPTFPRIHAECMVFMRYGRVACQRGECPNCDPPPGQSKRDQARDADAYYRANKGRRPSKKKEAAS